MVTYACDALVEKIYNAKQSEPLIERFQFCPAATHDIKVQNSTATQKAIFHKPPL